MDLIDGHVHNDLHWALLQLKDDADMRCAVIAAEGKCFSAGGDFNYMLKLNVSPELHQKSAWSEVEIIHTLTSIPVPVIAAVHGDAIVLGVSLTLGCDIVVASINAHIADPHVLVGLVAGGGGCLFWPRATGILQAKRYLLTGDYLPPRTAYEFGLMTDLAEGPEAVQPLADKFASKIASPYPWRCRVLSAASMRSCRVALRKWRPCASSRVWDQQICVRR